jgi:hypothetical protein
MLFCRLHGNLFLCAKEYSQVEDKEALEFATKMKPTLPCSGPNSLGYNARYIGHAMSTSRMWMVNHVVNPAT